METIRIDGLRELDQALRTFPERLQRLGQLRALKKAAAEFLAAMRAGVHRSAGAATHSSTGKPRRHLLDDLRIRAGRNRKTGDYTARVGPTKQTAYIANMLEFTGSPPHIIEAPFGGRLFIPGIGFVKKVLHPGFSAIPFMRPAFDTRVSAAIEVFRSELARQIESIVAKLRK